MTRFRDERGQAMVLSVLFLFVLVGMAALVVDVGSWYKADRDAQTTADAAALAAAQLLPDDTAGARAEAVEYGDANGGDVEAADVEITNGASPNDTVSVVVERTTPGFFAQLFGLGEVGVEAYAKARVGTPGEARWVAPIVVHKDNEMLNNCLPKVCEDEIELEYYHLKNSGPQTDGSGSFGFINLERSESNPGTSTLGDWIRDGFDELLDPNAWYQARTGNPFSSSHVADSLQAKLEAEKELLFPIYEKLVGNGSNAKYYIIGWAAFQVTELELQGSKEILHGHFTNVIWEAVQANPGATFSPGVKAVALVE
jgi:hypothetical protein